jgi:hypothetical protein
MNCISSRDFTDIRDFLKFVFDNKHNLIGIPKGLKSDFFASVKISTVDQQKNISENVKNTLLELLSTDSRLFQ